MVLFNSLRVNEIEFMKTHFENVTFYGNIQPDKINKVDYYFYQKDLDRSQYAIYFSLDFEVFDRDMKQQNKNEYKNCTFYVLDDEDYFYLSKHQITEFEDKEYEAMFI